jgi:hypothetical protein
LLFHDINPKLLHYDLGQERVINAQSYAQSYAQVDALRLKPIGSTPFIRRKRRIWPKINRFIALLLIDA